MPSNIARPFFQKLFEKVCLQFREQINNYLDVLRYIFKNEKKVGIQELGPRFTLKLRSLQKGTFDSKFGEYEWVLKVSLSALNFSLRCQKSWDGGTNGVNVSTLLMFCVMPLAKLNLHTCGRGLSVIHK